jgi:NAD(P)H-dependent FMN reductase
MTVISVIVGSTRQGRFSEKPAKWILQQLKDRDGIDVLTLSFVGHDPKLSSPEAIA